MPLPTGYVLDSPEKTSSALPDLKKEAAKRKPRALADSDDHFPETGYITPPSNYPKPVWPGEYDQPAEPKAAEYGSLRGWMTDRNPLSQGLKDLSRPVVGVARALGRQVGIDPEDIKARGQRVFKHPVDALVDALKHPPIRVGAEMIGGMVKHGREEVGQAYEAAKAGAPAAAASHTISAVPVVGPALDVAVAAAQAQGMNAPGKSYLENLKIAATTPETLGTVLGAATQITPLMEGRYAAFKDALHSKLPVISPEGEYLSPEEIAPPHAPPFVNAEIIRPPGLPVPRGEPPTIEGQVAGGPPPPDVPRSGAPPAAPVPTEGLTAEEQAVEQVITDRVAQHPKTEAEVRRDLLEVAPENRQAVLEAIHQRGLEAYQRGDIAAAGEAAQHEWVMRQIMQEGQTAASLPDVPEHLQGPVREITETMTRQQMLDELGIRPKSGDPRSRAAKARLAKLVAAQRASMTQTAPAPEAVAPESADVPRGTSAPELRPPETPVPEAALALATTTPENLFTQEQPATPEAEPGLVANVARKIGKSRKAKLADKEDTGQAALPFTQPPEAAAPLVPAPQAPQAAAPPEAPAPKPKAEVEWDEAGKAYEATAPEGYVDPEGNNTRVANVAKDGEFKTKAAARRAINKWEAGLIPVAQYRPKEPVPSPTVPPAAEPQAAASETTPKPAATKQPPATAAPEPEVSAAAPAPTGQVTVTRVKDAPAPTWQVEGTGIHIQLSGGAYEVLDGAERVGWGRDLDEAKSVAQQRKTNPQFRMDLRKDDEGTEQARPAPVTPATRQRPNIALQETLPGAKDHFEKLSRNHAELDRMQKELITVDEDAAKLQATYAQLSGSAPLSTIRRMHQELEQINQRRTGIRDHLHQLEEENAALRAADPNVGEVRLDPEGNPTLYLNKIAMGLVQKVIQEGVREGELHGADLTVPEARWVKNRLNSQPADINERRLLPHLGRLVDMALARSKQAGIAVVGKMEKGIQSAIGTKAEELFHRFQRMRSENGRHETHLSPEVFLNLFNALPDGIYDYLRNSGYEHDPAKNGIENYVIEAAAKIAANKWPDMGITKKEAFDWLKRYFDEVIQKHGPQAIIEIGHLRGFAREMQREVRDRYGSAATEGTGAEPAIQPAAGETKATRSDGTLHGLPGRGSGEAVGDIPGRNLPEGRGVETDKPQRMDLRRAQAERQDEDWLAEGVRQFAEQQGLQPPTATPVESDARVMEIADAYDAMKHEPDNPQVKASYDALKSDIDKQWDHATGPMGVTFEPWNESGQPYKNSAAMVADVKNNHHLFFFRDVEMAADHPMAEVDPKTGLTYNEKLRAVHDLFGHAVNENQFGQRGEENAWIDHSKIFSAEAIPALTSETKGQNSWVNSGPHMRGPDGKLLRKGDPGWKPATERPYAENKAGLLPERFHYRLDSPVSFVSPNVHGIKNLTEAERRLASRTHKLFQDVGNDLAVRMGIRSVANPALGHWQGGAENSVVTHFLPGTDPDAVIYHAAMMARVGNQNFWAAFIESPGGKDRLYAFHVHDSEASPDKIASILADNDIKNSTIEKNADGHTVWVASKEGSLRSNVQEAAQQLGGKDAGEFEGRSEEGGSYDSREAAVAAHTQRIEELERAHPEWLHVSQAVRAGRDYSTLESLTRETREPFLAGVHGSRTANIVEVSPEFAGKGPHGGGEAKRAAAYPEIFPKRSYFRIEGQPGAERFYTALPEQYRSLFNRENLVDIRGKLEELMAEVPSAERQRGAGFTYIEKLIKDKGYDGYFDSEQGVIVAFTGTPVESKLRSGGVNLPDAGEEQKPTRFDRRRPQDPKAGSGAASLEVVKKEAAQRKELIRLQRGLLHFDPSVEMGNENGAALIAGDGSVAVGDYHNRIRGDVGYGDNDFGNPEDADRWSGFFFNDGGVRVRANSGHIFVEFGNNDPATFERVRNVIQALPGDEFTTEYTPPSGGGRHRYWIGDRDSALERLDAWEAGKDRPAPAQGSMAQWREQEERQPTRFNLKRKSPLSIKEAQEQAEELRPKGSTVPIMTAALTPRYSVIGDTRGRGEMSTIAGHLEAATRASLRPLLPKEDDTRRRNAMIRRAVELAKDELKYQLAQDNSGANWYKADIDALIGWMRKLHPELISPSKDRIFRAIAATTSPGQSAAFGNIDIAEQAFALYKETGRIPLQRADGTSWGTYGNSPLVTLQAILDHFEGDEGKATRWLLTQHPRAELEEAKASAGFSKSTVKNALPPDADEENLYGAYVFGAKVGPFFLNLNGISTELTVDRWFMRTWNRWMGTLVGTDGQIQDVPRGKAERAAMIGAITELEKEFNLETSQIQAALWYYEQGLYTRLGQTGTFGGTYADAGRKVYELRSNPDAEYGGEDDRGRSDAPAGGVSRGHGAGSRKARDKNPESEGGRSTGFLFGNEASFDPRELDQP